MPLPHLIKLNRRGCRNLRRPQNDKVILSRAKGAGGGFAAGPARACRRANTQNPNDSACVDTSLISAGRLCLQLSGFFGIIMRDTIL